MLSVFEKKVDSGKADAELLMSRKMVSFSKHHSQFNVPNVLKIDRDNHILTLEHIHNATPLRQYYIYALKKRYKSITSLEDVIKMVAESIAIIHMEFGTGKSIIKYNLPDIYNNNNYETYLHGDLTLNNVLYNSQENKIYIIDWSTSSVFPFQANFGCKFWDITFFISSLFVTSPSTFYMSEIRCQIADLFIETYLNKSGLSQESQQRKDLYNYIKTNNYFILYRDHWNKSNLSFFKNIIFKKSHYDLNNFIQEKLSRYSTI